MPSLVGHQCVSKGDIPKESHVRGPLGALAKAILRESVAETAKRCGRFAQSRMRVGRYKAEAIRMRSRRWLQHKLSSRRETETRELDLFR